MRKSNPDFHHIRSYILMCVVSLTFSTIYAQTPEPKLTLKLQNTSLSEVIRQIEQDTGFSFIYGEEVKLDHKVSLNVQKKPLREVLNLLFANKPISYKITGKHILLQKTPPKPVSRKFTVSGYVTNGASAETLIGANILESRHHQGTTTNPYGFYSITLPEGEARLSFSYLGYTGQQHVLNLTADTLLNIRMKDNNMLQEVVIVSDKAESGVMATQMGASEIPMTQIKNTPSILGEADVMKAIQLMPGVQAGMEGSAGLYVRGGGPDQNLILLDGVPVYNVDHLLGFFSVFTPEAVKKVTLFKSSFPARFGGRLSSVIDVRTNDGDMKNYHGVVSVGLLTSKINFEGPIIKNRTSFNISARRSYIDLLAKPFMPKDEKYSYYFFDVNAKINHKFSDRSRLFLSAYNGKDHFMTKYDDTYYGDEDKYRDGGKMNWGNTIVSGRWNYIFNNKLFSNTTVAFNNYKFDVSTFTKNEIHTNNQITWNRYKADYKSGIRDWSAQIDFDYNPIPTHHVKFGVQYLHHSFRPEVSTSKIFDKTGETIERDTTYYTTSNSEILAHEASAYLEDNFNLSSRLRMNLGLHFSTFQVQKKNYFSVQPRISARYQLSKDVVLKASYTKMSQYVHLISSMPFAMPTDLWVPVTSKIKPMQAHQVSLGGYYTGIDGWEFSIEGYYKGMKNVLEYKDGVSFLGSSTGWEDKVEMGHGRSMGVEFMAQKTIGKTTGWLAYTLAKSDRKFATGGINNGERFPYKYDRRHNIDLTLNHRFNERIDVSASWIFTTGGTTTIPTELTGIIRPGDNDSSIEEGDYVKHRNNYRLPATHRLNVGVNFSKKTKHGMRIWNVSIYNVYNAMNPTLIYRTYKKTEYTQGEQAQGNRIPVIRKFTLLPCIPSFSYTYKF